MKWIQWVTIFNNNDGRRASGIGYRRSLWHILRSDSTEITLCGCNHDASVSQKRRESPESPDTTKTCSRCWIKAKNA